MLNGLDLFPHNKWAYVDVMESFKLNDRVCVIHPTGTGKSYIISTVCSNFNNVLILAPNKVILNQVMSCVSGGINVTYHTYSYLLNHDLCGSYDLIVLDEFHRCGALKWGVKVRELLDRNIGCKVFGTTATNIRNSDKRDMSIELFQGNIASMISIGDAIKNNILPKPLYIRGLYTFDRIFSEKYDLINRSIKISSSEKSRRIDKLKRMCKKWDVDCGVVSILKKHLYGSGIKKMIVFCDRIDSLDNMCGIISNWFNESGLVLDCIDVVHSKLSNNIVNEKISKFRSYNGSGISVMLAINMLNEGIHVDGVNCVMFLRKTCSNIIYLQQLGRGLITNAENRPIILDLVDNLTNKSEEVSCGNSGNSICSCSNKKSVISYLDGFEVTDYVVGIGELIEDLTGDLALNLRDKYIPFDERLKKFEEFVSSHGRLPSQYIAGEKDDYLNLRILRESHRDNLRVIGLINKYSQIKYSKDSLIKFIMENNRFPSCGNKSEQGLRKYMRKHLNSLMLDDEFSKLYVKYQKPYIINGKFDFNACYDIVDAYGKKYGRLPTSSVDGGIEFINARRCYTYLRNHYRDNELFINLNKKYSVTNKYKNFEHCMEIVSGFINENCYLPFSKEHGRANDAWNRLKYLSNTDTSKNFVKEMESEYGEITRLIKREKRSIAIKRSWEDVRKK